jgi:hypothetical protein
MPPRQQHLGAGGGSPALNRMWSQLPAGSKGDVQGGGVGGKGEVGVRPGAQVAQDDGRGDEVFEDGDMAFDLNGFDLDGHEAALLTQVTVRTWVGQSFLCVLRTPSMTECFLHFFRDLWFNHYNLHTLNYVVVADPCLTPYYRFMPLHSSVRALETCEKKMLLLPCTTVSQLWVIRKALTRCKL